MSEDELLRAVLDLAAVYGWRTYHARPARTKDGWRTPVQGNGKGFPDLLLLRGSDQLIVELKDATGKPTPEQWDWINAFNEACVPTLIWRPSDWPEPIHSILKSTPVLGGKPRE